MKDFFNIEKITKREKKDPWLNKLIIFHIICYLGLHLISWILQAFKIVASPGEFLDYFNLENTKVSSKPWTLFSYIFNVGMDPGYFLQDIVLLHFIGGISFKLFKRRLTLILYGLSILLTGLIFWQGIGRLPFFQEKNLVLSSAAPIYWAMLMAILVYDFHHKITFFVFEFSLKFLGLFLLAHALFYIGTSSEKEDIAGYYTLYLCSLLGGAIGAIYGLCLKKLPYFKRKMLILSQEAATNSTTSTTGPKVERFKPTVNSGPSLTNVDDILEKISRTGYQSLTSEERQTLFKAGK